MELLLIEPAVMTDAPALANIYRRAWLSAYSNILAPETIARINAAGTCPAACRSAGIMPPA